MENELWTSRMWSDEERTWPRLQENVSVCMSVSALKNVLERLHARTKLSEVFKFALRRVSADQKSQKVTNPKFNGFTFVNRLLRLDVHDLLKQVRISRVTFLYKCTHSIKSRKSPATVVDNLA